VVVVVVVGVKVMVGIMGVGVVEMMTSAAAVIS
jgi:hypothetical protein